MSRPEALGVVEWYAPLQDGGAADLPSDFHRREFQHHLSEVFRERLGLSQWGAAASPHPFPHESLKPGGPDFMSQLWLARSAEGFHLFVAGAGDQRQAVEIWRDAVETTIHRLGQADDDFFWSAIVGPDPDDASMEPTLVKAQFSGDEIVLRPPSRPIREVRDNPSCLGAYFTAETWPLVVDGRSRGYSWSAARHAAALDLRRIVALLSVVTQRPWILRHGPNLSEPGKEDIVRDRPHHLADDLFTEPWRMPAEVDPPPWFGASLAQLNGDQALLDAVLIHHEGLLLRRAHPSLAAAAQMTVLDSIGRRFTALKGNRDRIEAAAGQVASADVVADLKLDWNRRCLTMHEGRLHGDDLLGGVLSFELLVPHSSGEFTASTLYMLEQVANAAVTLVLDQRIEPGATPV